MCSKEDSGVCGMFKSVLGVLISSVSVYVCSCVCVYTVILFSRRVVDSGISLTAKLLLQLEQLFTHFWLGFDSGVSLTLEQLVTIFEC